MCVTDTQRTLLANSRDYNQFPSFLCHREVSTGRRPRSCSAPPARATEDRNLVRYGNDKANANPDALHEFMPADAA